MEDYSKVIESIGSGFVNSTKQVNSEIVKQNSQLAGVVEEAGDKTQAILKSAAELTDEATYLSREANALNIYRAEKKRELESTIIPNAQADLISMNKSVRDSRLKLNADLAEFENNEEFNNPSIGDMFLDGLKESFGIKTDKVKAQERIAKAQEAFNRNVQQRDILENTIADTSSLVTDRLKTDIELIGQANDIKNRILVNQGEVAKQEIYLKSVNANVDFASKVKALNTASLNTLLSGQSTVYEVSKANVRAEWEQSKAQVQAQESQERRLAMKENREFNRNLKISGMFSKQADAVARRLTAGAKEYTRVVTAVQKLGNFATEELFNSTIELGDKRQFVEKAQSDLSLIYSDLAVEQTPELKAKAQAKLAELAEVKAEYATQERKIMKLRTEAYIEKSRYDKEFADKRLAKINAIRVKGGQPEFASLDEFNVADKKYVAYINKLVTQSTDEQTPMDLIAVEDPQAFVANLQDMAANLGRTATESLVGEDALEVATAILENNRATGEKTMLSPKKAEREYELNTIARRDSRIAQYNALNTDAPSNEFTKFFQFKADDFLKFENNPLALSLGTVVKQSGTSLNTDMLNQFVESAIKEEMDSAGVSYTPALAEVSKSLASILGAVFDSKIDMKSLGLGASDRPVITLRTNRTGETRGTDKLDLSNPTDIIKLFLESKAGASPRWYYSGVDAGANENPTKNALELVPNKSILEE